MHLLLKYPTRHRWDRFVLNLQSYLDTSYDRTAMTVLMSSDTDDPMPRDVRAFLESQRVLIDVGYPKGKIEAINRSVKGIHWDVLVVVADDMIPQERGWDEIIRDDVSYHFPNGFGALNYNVDPRLGERWRSLITLPVMTRPVYDKFGYVYNPVYVSEWCDNEQTIVLERMGVLAHIDRKPILHTWHKDQDNLSMRNMIYGQVDRRTFESRKRLNFP